jgi:hypothetical protein
VTSLTDQLADAIAKARADAGLKAKVAAVLKEQERDENGRFAGGGGDGPATSPSNPRGDHVATDKDHLEVAREGKVDMIRMGNGTEGIAVTEKNGSATHHYERDEGGKTWRYIGSTAPGASLKDKLTEQPIERPVTNDYLSGMLRGAKTRMQQ